MKGYMGRVGYCKDLDIGNVYGYWLGNRIHGYGRVYVWMYGAKIGSGRVPFPFIDSWSLPSSLLCRGNGYAREGSRGVGTYGTEQGIVG